MSVLQEAPYVLAGVAGHLNEGDLSYAGVACGTHGGNEAVVGGLLALLGAPVGGRRLLKVCHRLLLVHGAMVAQRNVATTMIPP